MFELGRNDKCWCGSEKKYKICHFQSDENLISPLIKQGYIIPTRDLILSKNDINGIKESSKISVSILDNLETIVKKGMSTEEINKIVHKMTLDAGATPAPLNYNGFPKSVCTSINNVVCHGIPSEKDILKDGDILNIDITTIKNGYYSDISRMFLIGNVSENARKLVEVTKECLEVGISTIKPYTPVGNIGSAINNLTDKHGYSVVRALCGHGIGLKFHNEPMVNHFRSNKKTMIMVPGMVFTIEPMINEGDFDCYVLDDDWTVVTSDDSLSAQWEHTVLVTESGVEILTL